MQLQRPRPTCAGAPLSTVTAEERRNSAEKDVASSFETSLALTGASDTRIRSHSTTELKSGRQQRFHATWLRAGLFTSAATISTDRCCFIFDDRPTMYEPC